LHDNDLGEMQSKALIVERGLTKLDGTRIELEREQQRNREIVGAAKWRVGQREMVDRIFEATQARLHNKAVGSYERLLTTIANDVLPSRIRVRLDLGTNKRNGKASLDIVAERDGGPVDVCRGSGGSLMNVLATGLRVSALCKSGARQFVAFDESECWLSPDNVPAYGNVLERLSSDLGFQCLLISHHDPRMFRGAFIVRLDGTPETGLVAIPEGPVPNGGARHRPDLLTSIRLVGFQSHCDTTVPLAPGMTCLVGGNDIGKSAVVRALTAIMEGDFRDSDIRHGEREASVEVRLADGRIARVRRSARKYVKTRWELELPSGACRASDGSDVPDFIAAALGMHSIGDLNLHVARQTRPNFLLDDDSGMDTKRAEVLSVGREAVHLDRLMEAWKRKVREDGVTIRKGEEDDARLALRLQGLADVPRLLGAAGRVRKGIDALRTSSAELADLDRDATALEAAIARRVAIEAAAGTLSPLADPPSILETGTILAAIENMERLDREVELASSCQRVLGPMAAPPELVADEGLSEAADRLTSAMGRTAGLTCRLRVLADLPPPPELTATAGLAEAAQEVGDVSTTLAGLRAEAAVLEAVPAPPELMDDEGLGEFSERLDEAARLSISLGREDAVLTPLAPPPALHPTDGLVEACLLLEAAAFHLLSLTDASRAVMDLPPPPQLEPTADLITVAERLEGAVGAASALSSMRSSLEALAPPPELQETAGIDEAAARLDTAARDAAELSSRLAMLDRVAVPPLLLATDGLQEAADGLEAARLEIESLRREAARLDGQHAEVEERLAKWREDNRGVCPTCGREGYDPLAHGGVHAHH
jgi:hypothetical protein